MLLSNRWRKRRDRLWRRRVLRDPLLAGQLCGRLNDIAMLLLSLDLGGGFSVDSICHLADCPRLTIQRTFDELFSNAPQFADALRIVLVNRLCEHNSQLISKLLFARQPANLAIGIDASEINGPVWSVSGRGTTGAFRSSRTDRGAQVLPPAGATVPPWLPAKSAHASN
jgi:hypothetical protein